MRILITAFILFILPLLWLGGCMWRDFSGSDEAPAPDTFQPLAPPQLTDLRQELIEYLRSRGITFVSRKDWGATNSSVAETSTIRVEGIIIHHSASTNTAADWAGQVRAIQQFHISQNWPDIGYNFLIDPNGKIYEGRVTKNGFWIGVSESGEFYAVIGNHTAAKSLNTKAVGINFLGCFLNNKEYEDATKCNTQGLPRDPVWSPTPQALNAAKVLIEWLATKIGKASCYIMAHRDVEPNKPYCPGWNVYTKLPEFREAAGIGKNVSLSTTSLYLPAQGGKETITVTSDHWWQVYSGSDWIVIEKTKNYEFYDGCGKVSGVQAIGYGNQSVTILVKPNETLEKRTGSIVIGGVLVTIKQEGKVATPVFSPAPGTFQGMVWVKITCATPGATIRYTIDGTTPTEKSPQYTEPILITTTTTLKARAFKNEMNPSDIATATYKISIPTFLTQFSIFVHNTQVRKGWDWLQLPNEKKPMRIQAGKYMRIEEVEPGKKWRLGVEDLTEEVNESVDWDYDEPLLEIKLLNPKTGELLIRGLRITGVYRHDLWYGNQRVYEALGGGDIFDFGTWYVSGSQKK